MSDDPSSINSDVPQHRDNTYGGIGAPQGPEGSITPAELNREIITGFRALFEGVDSDTTSLEYKNEDVFVRLGLMELFDDEYYDDPIDPESATAMNIAITDPDSDDPGVPGMQRKIQLGDITLPDRFMYKGDFWLGMTDYVLDFGPGTITRNSIMKPVEGADLEYVRANNEDLKELSAEDFHEILVHAFRKKNIELAEGGFISNTKKLHPNEYAYFRHILQQIKSGELQPVLPESPEAPETQS